ncbi:hypothetical protein DW624_RS11800 [Enterococcus hirae]
MNNQIPKAVKVEMMSTFLKIEFDNGVIKYLKSHLNKEHAEAYSMKKGKKKNVLLAPNVTWLGSDIKINTDGSIVVNENDEYSPSELWNESKEHIDQL